MGHVTRLSKNAGDAGPKGLPDRSVMSHLELTIPHILDDGGSGHLDLWSTPSAKACRMLGFDILVVKSDQSDELVGVDREVWISHLGGIHSRRPHAVADSAPKFVPVNDGRSPFLDRPLAVRGHAFLAGIERVQEGKRTKIVGPGGFVGARNALELDPKDDARTVH